MAHSKRIKDQSSTAKRVATYISKVIEDFETPGIIHKSAGISHADRDALLKAATILRRIGSEKAKIAKTEKANELQREKLIAQTKVTAEKMLSEWPLPTTNLDKVSFISITTIDYSLERYLIEGLPVWNRDVVAADWTKMFNDLLDEANKEITETAAFRAVATDKPIEEVMIAAAEKIEMIKSKPKTKNLAEKWSAKMNS